MFGVVLTDARRTTLIHVLPWSSLKSLTCPSKNSSRRRCGKSSIGQSNRWRKTGSSEKQVRVTQRFQDTESEELGIATAATLHGLAWISKAYWPWMRGGQFGRQIAKDCRTCGLHGMTGRTFACMERLVHHLKRYLFSLHRHLPYSYIEQVLHLILA